MALLYILIGLLIGWLIEWLVDWFYWRGRVQAVNNELQDCKRSLMDERERSKQMQLKISALEDEKKSLRARLLAVEADADRYKNERDAALQEANSLKTESRAGGKADAEDDLKKIEGIGPKIEQVLKNAGVRTFKELATTPSEQLKEILAAAGKRFRLADPTTWPRQAALAADGKWRELQDYQDALQGGREG